MYRIGSIRFTNAKFYSSKKIKWSNGPLNVLEVWVSQDQDELRDLNYSDILKKMKVTISSWSTRGLSLFGKILIINSLITSLYMHRLMVLPKVPEEIYKEWKKVILNFIWNNSKPKISYEIMVGSKQIGGAGLIDLAKRDQAIKLSWVSCAIHNPVINSLADKALSNDMGHLFWQANLSKNDVLKLFSCKSFWINVLQEWIIIHFSKPANAEEMKGQIFWLNSFITINNLRVKDTTLFQRGVNICFGFL